MTITQEQAMELFKVAKAVDDLLARLEVKGEALDFGIISNYAREELLHVEQLLENAIVSVDPTWNLEAEESIKLVYVKEATE